MPAVLERKARILGAARRRARADGGRWPRQRSRARSSGPRRASSGPTSTPWPSRVQGARPRGRPPRSPSIYKSYEREKRSRGVVDFDDLLVVVCRRARARHRVRGGQRWRIRHLFVDEFQDVSPAQLRLLRGWLGERNDLCVVGDPDQAIYAFAGADPRSSPSSRATSAARPSCVSTATTGPRRSRRRRPRRCSPTPGARAPRGARCVRAARRRSITIYDTDDAEAAGIAERLRAAHGQRHRVVRPCGALPHERAVGRASRRRSRSAAIPLQGARRRPVPRAARGPGRARALRRTAKDGRTARSPTTSRTCPRSRDRPGARRRAPQRRSATRARKTTSPHSRASVDEYLDLEGEPGARRRVRGVPDRVAARGVASTPAATPSSCSPSIARRASSSTRCSSPASSAAWCRSSMPTRRTSGPRSADSSTSRSPGPKRCCISRTPSAAHARPACRRAGSAAHGSSRSNRAASRRTAPAPRARARRATAIAAKHAAASNALARSTTERHERPRELLAALVEWRRNLARASGVPAYVIFHNMTLKAVAAVQADRSRDDLLAVPGIGPVKVERHADAVLELVRRHGN